MITQVNFAEIKKQIKKSKVYHCRESQASSTMISRTVTVNSLDLN
jgi:hypothetical protein